MFHRRERKKHSEKTRALMADLHSSLFLFLVAVGTLVLAALSLAWFAMNQAVDSDGMSTSVDDSLFELGVVKTGAARAVTVNGTALDVLSQDVTRKYSHDALETVDGSADIICALESDDGAPLRPGSFGTLRFRLLPKKDGYVFHASAILSGVKKIPGVDPGDPPTYAMIDPDTDVAGGLALDYLAGHLLFFQSDDYAQSNRVDLDEGFAITGADEADREYLVTLYWYWPRVYNEHAQYIDDDWLTRFSYLHDGVRDEGYNNADQIIGERIAYAVVEVQVGVEDTTGLKEIVATELP